MSFELSLRVKGFMTFLAWMFALPRMLSCYMFIYFGLKGKMFSTSSIIRTIDSRFPIFTCTVDYLLMLSNLLVVWIYLLTPYAYIASAVALSDVKFSEANEFKWCMSACSMRAIKLFFIIFPHSNWYSLFKLLVDHFDI